MIHKLAKSDYEPFNSSERQRVYDFPSDIDFPPKLRSPS